LRLVLVYAGQFARKAGDLHINLVDGLRPAKLVAGGFTAFVNSALADAANIYPNVSNREDR
jgi:hypothetical protein